MFCRLGVARTARCGVKVEEESEEMDSKDTKHTGNVKEGDKDAPSTLFMPPACV